MALFKKIFGGPGDTPPPASPAPAGFPLAGPEIQQWAALHQSGTEFPAEPVPCDGIDWNREVVCAFHGERLPRYAGQPGGIDQQVLYAMLVEHAPTRVMEVGSGETTLTMRRAFKDANLPGELIAIDPTPTVDITEAVDAPIDQPVQEIPLSDFQTLQAGEVLVLDLTHTVLPGGDVLYIYQRILPALHPGVIVGVRGVRLPVEYPADEASRGFAEQALLQMYLTHNARAEILYAGGWLEANGYSPAGTWLWFRQRANSELV